MKLKSKVKAILNSVFNWTCLVVLIVALGYVFYTYYLPLFFPKPSDDQAQLEELYEQWKGLDADQRALLRDTIEGDPEYADRKEELLKVLDRLEDHKEKQADLESKKTDLENKLTEQQNKMTELEKKKAEQQNKRIEMLNRIAEIRQRLDAELAGNPSEERRQQIEGQFRELDDLSGRSAVRR